MIAGISGIGAPGTISNVTAASLGRVGAVSRVVKQVDGSGSQPVPFQEESPKPQFDGIQLPDRDAELPGESYGHSANRLRNLGLEYKLLGEEGSENSENEVMGPADEASASEESENSVQETDEDKEKSENADNTKPKGSDGKPLSDEDIEVVRELELRDAEVRAHEQAHMAAAGGYAMGGPKYEYQRGPDGKSYAIGGSVQIDTSPESTPEKTVKKMQKVRAAAMAPAQPSGQDRAVAAAAMQQMMKATQELYHSKNEDEENPLKGIEASEAEHSGEMKETEQAPQSALPEIEAIAEEKEELHPSAPDSSGISIAPSAPSEIQNLSYQQMQALAAYSIAG